MQAVWEATGGGALFSYLCYFLKFQRKWLFECSLRSDSLRSSRDITPISWDFLICCDSTSCASQHLKELFILVKCVLAFASVNPIVQLLEPLLGNGLLLVYRSRFQFRDLTIFSYLLHPCQSIASRMWQILFKHMPFRLPVCPIIFLSYSVFLDFFDLIAWKRTWNVQ